MIYLAATALLLTLLGFSRKVQRNGFQTAASDSVLAAVAGFGAGLFIGFGARLGMWAIAFFNGDASRFSVAGSLQVVLLFSSFGIGLGLLYEILLRDVLRRRGLLFGVIVTLCTWYPFSEAAADVLRFRPTLISLVFFTGVFTALMWLPFAVTLEIFLNASRNKLKKTFLSGWLGKKAKSV